MTEYKCVNFSELCRLCANSNRPRVGIFTDEGRKKNIRQKIIVSLGITIKETDRLPKSVCATCVKQVETHDEFRESVVKAQSMLENCVENGDKVYIRDVKAKDPIPTVVRPQQSVVQVVPTLPVITNRSPQAKQASTSQQLQQQQQQRQQPQQRQQQQIIVNSIPKTVVQTVNGNSSSATLPTNVSLTNTQNTPKSSTSTAQDFLSSIIQAVGIKNESDINRAVVQTVTPQQQQQQQISQPQILTIQNTQQPNQQYTITFDGQPAIKTNNQHYKLENGTLVPVISKPAEMQPQTTFTQVDEFIKIKSTPPKPIKRETGEAVKSDATAAKRKRVIQIVKHMPTPQTSPPKPAATVGSYTIENPSIASPPPVASSGTIVCNTGGGTTIYTSTPQKTYTTLPTGNKCILPIPPKLVHASVTGPKPTQQGASNVKGGNSSGGASVGKSLPTATARASGQNASTNKASVSSLNHSNEHSDGTESAESEANRSAQSLRASQQMSAISAMSSKQDPVAATDQQANSSSSSGGGERGGGTGGRSGGPEVSITTCDVCQKTFGRKEHLVQHLKSHIGLRPFKCDDPGCNKSFSRKEHLLRHTVSHTGQKMFSCDKCHKLFSRKDNLNKHRKTHQDQGNISPYSCTVCNTDFASKKEFQRHKDSQECYEEGEEEVTQKISHKKEPPRVVAKQNEINTVTMVEAAEAPKQASQPPPLAHTSVASVVSTAETPQQATVVQSLPMTIAHVPTSTATIQLPICTGQTQTHLIQQPQQQQQQHNTLQQHQQSQPQNGTATHQQIFTIPTQFSTANGKSIIQHLQIALPNSVTNSSSATGNQTVQTISTAQGATLASLGTGRATIINSVDGNTMFTLPPNFIFDASQIITATSRQS
uniref:Protein krueppel n=1 Tax=Anopheles farauti TaxID=69004 RepID=A0A182Q1H5_9DIPT